MIEDISEEVALSDELNKEIEKEVNRLKKEGNKRVFPIVVEGDEDDEKDIFVAYFKRPSAMDLSKFQTMSPKNPQQALRQLAKDSFIGGDKILIDDDDLFAYGLQGQIMEICSFRKSRIVNLSKPGK